jgi:hypothetical protein
MLSSKKKGHKKLELYLELTNKKILPALKSDSIT